MQTTSENGTFWARNSKKLLRDNKQRSKGSQIIRDWGRSVLMGHLHDGIIYCYDQNPSRFSFLVQITAFVI